MNDQLKPQELDVVPVIIAAVSGERRVIGLQGGLPWHIPEDLKWFREITLNHPVIFGSRTLKSFPNARPLPHRFNIMLSRQITTASMEANLLIVKDFDEALRRSAGWYRDQQQAPNLVAPSQHREVFIIGGEAIYTLALQEIAKRHLKARMILTVINENFDGDRFFPDINAIGGWTLSSKDVLQRTREGISYQRWHYQHGR